MNDKSAPPSGDRRAFLKQSGAIVLGGTALGVPFAAGLRVFSDPLGRANKGGGFLHITSLAAIPEDGVPRKFSVIAHRHDAWNRYPEVPIGAVYLRRTGTKVQALQVACPHAGCFVDFSVEKKLYLCPCHNSSFEVDGRVSNPSSPAPRGLDELQVEVRGVGEVWVKFQSFVAGTAEKTPVA